MVHWASGNLSFKNFIYPVAVENYASRHIAESLGGVISEYKNKPKYDSVTYAIPPHTE